MTFEVALVRNMGSDERLVFVDGFRTTAADLQKWIETFEERCSSPKPLGYSYNRSTEEYDLQDTHISIPGSAKDFESFLMETGGVLIPVGFSLGAPLALRGTRRALDGYADITVKKVVLIAPAFWPKDSVPRVYRKAKVSAQAITELTEQRQRLHRILYRDLQGLLEDEIPVVVLHSALDDWCPWLPGRLPPSVANSAFLTSIDLEKDMPREAGIGAIQYHLSLKDHDHTLEAVCTEVTT